MSSGQITSLRLTAFKSYQDTEMPLAPLTVMIGRNGSGKSNALDALEVLSRLAQGEEVRDALDGGRRGDAGPVRGGIDGCPPSGTDEFEIGATVEDGDGFCADLDVRVQVRPRVQIVYERLEATVGKQSHVLLVTEDPDLERSDLGASVWNGTGAATRPWPSARPTCSPPNCRSAYLARASGSRISSRL